MIVGTVVVVVLLAIVAYLAFMAGSNEGAAGAGAAAMATAEFMRRRTKKDREILAAVDRAGEAIDEVEGMGNDADEVVDDARDEVAGTDGEDKARMIDDITDPS
jgi:malic enzyme